MKCYIITGEASADLHAANLLRELKKFHTNLDVRGWGGDRMINEGVDVVRHIRDYSFMGFSEVLYNIFKVTENITFCKHDLRNEMPDFIVLIDYSSFNLRIAKFAKSIGVKVFYYIPPKVWAWNKNRISKIQKYVDHLLVIFPFEVDFYKRHDIHATYVGNPLLDEIYNSDINVSYKFEKPIIALLPGSRKQEIDKILPVMVSVTDSFSDYQFVIACTSMFSTSYYESFIYDKNIKLVFDETYPLLSQAKAALVTSGTATLETALFEVPQVVCYKTNYLSYFIAKMMLDIKYISLVNILLDRQLISELIQSELNKNNLMTELNIILDNSENLIKGYKELRELLGSAGASKKAAEYITHAVS